MKVRTKVSELTNDQEIDYRFLQYKHTHISNIFDYVHFKSDLVQLLQKAVAFKYIKLNCGQNHSWLNNGFLAPLFFILIIYNS